MSINLVYDGVLSNEFDGLVTVPEANAFRVDPDGDSAVIDGDAGKGPACLQQLYIAP